MKKIVKSLVEYALGVALAPAVGLIAGAMTILIIAHTLVKSV